MDQPVELKRPDAVTPVPLVIAVSGHRDLVADEIPEIRRRVREFLQVIKANCGTTPVAVMTPLAEGAGQLVAREALQLGLALIVPLPMPADLYLAGFCCDEQRQGFRELAQQADVFELPLVAGNTRESIAEPGPARDKQYAQLAMYLSGHCHLLLALWDGKPSDLMGGTAQVVRYHQTDLLPGVTPGRKRARQLITDYESDLVYQVVCSRDRPGGEPASGLQSLQSFYLTANPDHPRTEQLPQAYRLMFRRTCEFNRDAAKYAAKIIKSEPRLLRDAVAHRLPDRLLGIASLFRSADFLARHFQVRVHTMLRVTYTLAALMGLAFIFYADVAGFGYMIYVFLALFAFGAVLYAIAVKRDWQRKYLDYRVLAEGLRVQFFWLVAGVSSRMSIQFAHDNFLQKQDVELGWIRNAMRAVSVGPQEEPVPGVFPNPTYVIERWIGEPGTSSNRGQIRYFQRQMDQKWRYHQMTTALARLCLWIGIAVTLVLAVLDNRIAESTESVLLVLMGVLPLAAAVREAYAHKKADRELIKQYRFMQRLFCNARAQLAVARDDDERRDVLRALGEAALDEHAEWILMHRERPLEHSWL